MKSVPVWLWVVLGLLAIGAGGGVVAMSSGVDVGLLQKVAEAIATAEGYFVAGSRPNRNNNPGDLTLDLGFPSSGKDGMFVIFQTADDGWAALRRQVELMLTNQSHIYNAGMTIYQVATKYTLTDATAWASIVSNVLGVDMDTPLSSLVATSSGDVMNA